MKRLLILLMMAVTLTGIASAQTANRNGFFMEVGIGGMVGDSPRTSISVVNNVVQYKCASGTAVDFALGGRFRFARHWAYELKAEAQTTLADPENTLVGRALPIGFRYTSGELWRNYSIYAHLNLGGAITVNRGVIDTDKGNLDNNTFYPNTPDRPIKGYVGEEGYGAAYSLGIGVNVTTHLYVEACYNGQSIFACFGKNGKGMVNYGLVGCVIGYRF